MGAEALPAMGEPPQLPLPPGAGRAPGGAAFSLEEGGGEELEEVSLLGAAAQEQRQSGWWGRCGGNRHRTNSTKPGGARVHAESRGKGMGSAVHVLMLHCAVQGQTMAAVLAAAGTQQRACFCPAGSRGVRGGGESRGDATWGGSAAGRLVACRGFAPRCSVRPERVQLTWMLCTCYLHSIAR